MAMIDKGIIKKERERERERTNKHRFDLRDKKAKRCERERDEDLVKNQFSFIVAEMKWGEKNKYILQSIDKIMFFFH